MVGKYGVAKEGIYSEDKFAEMEAKYEGIRTFLKQWAEADDKVFDADGEKFRSTLRRLTKEKTADSMEVYEWWFNMAYEQMSWRDGKRYPSTHSAGYNYGSRDPESLQRYVRRYANSISRDTWRL